MQPNADCPPWPQVAVVAYDLALGEDLAHPRISKLIAETRHDEPDVDIEVTRASLIVQLAELRAGRMDIGFVLQPIDLSALFARKDDSQRSHALGDDTHVVSLWKDAVVAIVKPGSIIAAQSVARLSDLTAGPIVLVGEPTQSRSGRQYDVEFVANVDMLLTLVGAGRGIGLINAAQAETLQWSDLVVHPLESPAAQIQTLLLSRGLDRATLVMRFAERAQRSLKEKTR